jgi:hypothetical protein
VRWTLGGYAALSSLCALVLFLAHVRRSDRLLSSRLREAGVESGAEERSLFPLASATLALFFAFSLGVLWIVAR